MIVYNLHIVCVVGLCGFGADANCLVVFWII